MALERRLKRWNEAGLIDAQQLQKILDFEKGQERPTFLYAVAGLGGLAIAIGIVSIVAANWDYIPGQFKIAANLLLLFAASVAVVRLRDTFPLWAREAALLVLYGFAMGSIALVGQVYQLGGSVRVAMATWSLLTAPLMAMGSGAFLALIWLMGLQSTFAAWMIWLCEWPIHEDGWALAGTAFVPWLLLSLGYSRWFARLRPFYASVFAKVGWAEVVACASIGATAFYERTIDEPWLALWGSFAVAALMVAWLWYQHSKEPEWRITRWLLVVCLLLTYLPARMSPGDWDLLSALLFIGLWLLVAFAAHSNRLYRILNLATAVIGVRIVVVYFEVFGSLLDTGLGLVTGGVLTLLLTWLWWRTRRQLRQERSL